MLEQTDDASIWKPSAKAVELLIRIWAVAVNEFHSLLSAGRNIHPSDSGQPP